MFGKKPTVKNSYDERMKELYNELSEISFKMNNLVQQIYVKGFVIQMFPDGADKNLEVEEINNLRARLLRKVACYDSKRLEIIDYLETNKEKCNCNWVKPLTSHCRIESYVSTLVKK